MVTPELLEKTARRINSKAKEYEKLYNDMYKKAGDLEFQWKGKDSKAFYDKIANFIKKDFVQMKKLMDAYADQMIKMAKGYVGTEDGLREQAKKL